MLEFDLHPIQRGDQMSSFERHNDIPAQKTHELKQTGDTCFDHLDAVCWLPEGPILRSRFCDSLFRLFLMSVLN